MAGDNWFEYFVIVTFLLSFVIAIGIFYLSSARPVLGGRSLHEFIHFALHDSRTSPRLLTELREGILSLTQNFGRVYLALFVTFVIGVLLYLKVISAEAGLPILSGIAGFALGNTPNSSQGPPPGAPG